MPFREGPEARTADVGEDVAETGVLLRTGPVLVCSEKCVGGALMDMTLADFRLFIEFFRSHTSELIE